TALIPADEPTEPSTPRRGSDESPARPHRRPPSLETFAAGWPGRFRVGDGAPGAHLPPLIPLCGSGGSRGAREPQPPGLDRDPTAAVSSSRTPEWSQAPAPAGVRWPA